MLTFSTEWFEPISLGPEGIVSGRQGAFGLGTLLVLKCSATQRVLMARKSFREGFEGSNQFTLPGGMLRSDGALEFGPLDFNRCLGETLAKRVQAETGVALKSVDGLVSLDQWPPIVGRYTIRGDQLVAASILPFYGETQHELSTLTNDPTVHSAAWYDPVEVMHEVTQTNALILAQVFWPDWSVAEQEKIKPILLPHFEAVLDNAEFVGAWSPISPWSERQAGNK
ncbi:MAG: NUDIX domain-containing protein [Pseudomonadota bacterium]